MTTLERIGQTHWEERGERIESARKFVGFSQGELAEKVSQAINRKISRQVIFNIETGKRDIRGDELEAIAYYLAQDPDWLNCKPKAEYNPLAKKRVLVSDVLGLLTHQILATAA